MKQQYLIVAYDATDEDAINRRMDSRNAHLERVKELKAQGSFREGGAILDNTGKMIGSALIVAFDTRDDLDAWLSRDPYVLHHVWHNVEIRPFRCAPV